MALTVAQIEDAITKILTTGQSVTIDGVTYTRASLDQLQTLRAAVQGEEAVATRGHLFDRSLTGAVRR